MKEKSLQLYYYRNGGKYNMEQRDLRKWISQLENENLLKRVSAEVDWNLEIGSITRKVTSQEGPALLFEDIKDHKDTWGKRFFTNGVGSEERIALALNLDRKAGYREIVRTIKDRLFKLIKPIFTDNGPVKENIIRENKIDLYQFPVPKFHLKDGGRYINTTASIVTKDPDTGEYNLGIYRGMVVEKNKIGLLLVATQHWGFHYAKYKARGEPMPVACVYGWDPCLFFVSSMPIQHPYVPFGEYEHCGGLRESPVELIKCETSDLMVPASAEIVIEGVISPDPKDYVMEGPFGEYPGYYGGARSPKPAIEVKCITFRNDPILRGLLEGSTPGKLCEDGYWYCVGQTAAAWHALVMAGVPNVLDVWTPRESTSTILRVRIDKLYRGHANQVASAIWGTTVGNYAGKFVIVVDKDIDIHDEGAVNWAIAYRCNPGMDQILFYQGCGSALDPSVPLSVRNPIKYGQGKWTKVLIDATKNWELEKEEQYGGEIFPPIATEIGPEQEALINRRWKEYGF
ncbi:MAG: UbiD family decarboxylase [Pseudomonadota bacterium]